MARGKDGDVEVHRRGRTDLDVASVRALEISVAMVSQLPKSSTRVVPARRDHVALPTWQLLACPPFCQRWLLCGELDQGTAVVETKLCIGIW